jgi:hypothetical protein
MSEHGTEGGAAHKACGMKIRIHPVNLGPSVAVLASEVGLVEFLEISRSYTLFPSFRLAAIILLGWVSSMFRNAVRRSFHEVEVTSQNIVATRICFSTDALDSTDLVVD